MAGTMKIWWHDGATRDVRYHDIPVVNEPELGFETVPIQPVATFSGPAPEHAVVALVECDVDVRYVVRRPGETVLADPDNSKPIQATGMGTDSIGVAPGYSISFIQS